jgi:hypothetical protein
MKEIKNKTWKANPLGYGEITYKGMLTLFNAFDVNEGDMFCDIGSGYGKLTTAYNDFFGEKSFGIEIAKEKYDIAKKINKFKPKKYEFINDDYTNQFHILDKCRFIYCNGVLFGETIKPLFKYMAERTTPCTLFHNNFEGRSIEWLNIEVCWADQVKFYKLITTNNR